MATQQVNAAKLKSTGVNLTNLAAKMKSEMNKLDENIQKVSSVWSGGSKCFVFKTISGRQSKSGPADPDLTADGSSSPENFPTVTPRQITRPWIWYINIWVNREVSVNGRRKY